MPHCAILGFLHPSSGQAAEQPGRKLARADPTTRAKEARFSICRLGATIPFQLLGQLQHLQRLLPFDHRQHTRILRSQAFHAWKTAVAACGLTFAKTWSAVRPSPRQRLMHPHFVRDIKESAGGGDGLKRIMGLLLKADSCEFVRRDLYAARAGESVRWQHRVGGCDGHPGAVLFQQRFARYSAACWSKTFMPRGLTHSATPPWACCITPPWLSYHWPGPAVARNFSQSMPSSRSTGYSPIKPSMSMIFWFAGCPTSSAHEPPSSRTDRL